MLYIDHDLSYLSYVYRKFCYKQCLFIHVQCNMLYVDHPPSSGPTIMLLQQLTDQAKLSVSMLLWRRRCSQMFVGYSALYVCVWNRGWGRVGVDGGSFQMSKQSKLQLRPLFPAEINTTYTYSHSIIIAVTPNSLQLFRGLDEWAIKKVLFQVLVI